MPDLPLSGAIRPQALYVHVPFCFHKCHYCDFYSLVDGQDRHGPFVERLGAEIRAAADLIEGPLQTIFVGGGTPTLLEPSRWAILLDEIATRMDLGPGAEFTVEANPETVTAPLVEILAGGGVNRVSVGCQSFDRRHLRTLERHHDPENVARSVGLLRTGGITNLNLDLIFGIPGQTLDDWRRDLELALALEPEHLSCYSLTYEPNTALTARLRAGKVTPVEDDLEAAMYETARERLAAAGFEHYEISAWARPGRRCRHNLVYWTNGDWWPLGPGAAGHVGGLRWKNAPRLGDYLEDHSPWTEVIDVEPPDPERAIVETLMVGLRLLDGLPLERVNALLVEDHRRRAVIDEQIASGLLEQAAGHLRLTDRGLMLADSVISELL